MLKLKPNCECCDVDLPADSSIARMCSYECTFCNDCSDSHFGGNCPNCGGELVKRPIRPAKWLKKDPAMTQRELNPAHASLAHAAQHSNKHL